jgi:hypothetical protein
MTLKNILDKQRYIDTANCKGYNNMPKSEDTPNNVIMELNNTTIRILTPRGPKTYNVAEIFAIDENELSSEFANQAAVYAYFSSMMNYVEKQMSNMDLKLDQVSARLDEFYRQQLERNDKKYTEAVVKSLVVRDDEYKAAYEASHIAKYDYGVLKSLARALEQRADMLISLGSHLRHEADMAGLSIRETKYTQAVDDAKQAIKNRH